MSPTSGYLAFHSFLSKAIPELLILRPDLPMRAAVLQLDPH
jgi:hypothetical protein